MSANTTKMAGWSAFDVQSVFLQSEVSFTSSSPSKCVSEVAFNPFRMLFASIKDVLEVLLLVGLSVPGFRSKIAPIREEEEKYLAESLS